MTRVSTLTDKYSYVWFWRARLPERKGQPCRVLVRGKRNSALVEFPDGFRVITSRFAVRRRPRYVIKACAGYLAGFGAGRHDCGPYFTADIDKATVYEDTDTVEHDRWLTAASVTNPQVVSLKCNRVQGPPGRGSTDNPRPGRGEKESK